MLVDHKMEATIILENDLINLVNASSSGFSNLNECSKFNKSWKNAQCIKDKIFFLKLSDFGITELVSKNFFTNFYNHSCKCYI